MNAPSPKTASKRVWLLIAALALLAFQLQLATPHANPPALPLQLPWWVLSILFFVAEIYVVHLQFRREAQSFSLSELPLVLGLFLVRPDVLLVARLLGAGLALRLFRRQRPLKLAFNLAHFSLETSLAAFVFHRIVDLRHPLEPSGWAATFLATGLTTVVGVGLVALAISLTGSELRIRTLPHVLGVGVIVAVTNASVALIAVTVWWRAPSLTWLILVPAATLVLVYRAYAAERQKHTSLESLYESTRVLHGSLEVESAILELLSRARTMFRADIAELLLLPSGAFGSGSRTRLGPGDQVAMLQPGEWQPAESVLSEIMAGDKAVAVSRPVRDERLGRQLTLVGFKDAMVAPLRGKRGVVGTMLVANRLGDVSTFDTDDLKLFETLANHASVALENAQLVGRLEESLAQVTGTMRELEEAEARFRSLVQNASDVILVVQADATIRYETPSITRVLGYEPDQLNGAHFTTLLHPNDRERADAFFAEATNGGGSAVAEWRVRHRDGTWRHIEATCNNLLHDPAVNGVVTTIRDVSERKLLEDELRRQAFQDPLTKLANRALLLDRVAHGLARRRSDEHPLALLLLDLDDFKVVNDSLGHAAGDELLVAVADRLNSCLRTADTAARLGGDEFAVLLDQVTGQTEAAAVAERIIEQLKAPVYLDGKEVFVHASLGVALSDRDVQDAEALLRDADAAMYAAKAAGKGRCQFFEPHLHTTALDRLQRRADLERAVDQQQFVLHYQPIIELSTQQIVGAEALVRWQHPERGLVPPAEFIPLAEETGLIVPLGRWVLEQACQQAHQWHRDHPGARPLRISIHLSAQQFQHPGLIAEVAHAIQTVNLDPSTLVLEITETLLMQDVQATGVKLHGLKALGVQLAIDDFGTGYSSLSYLKHFPIDILKIDKAFVEGVDGNAEDAALAHAILKLGQTLQLQTLAEGIERTKQCQALHALGCQYGQGYLFAKPLPPAGIPLLLDPQHQPGVAPL